MDPGKRVSRSGKQPTPFGAWLLREMARRDLTQSDLGRATGNEPNAVARWIYVYKRPSPEICSQIAHAFGMDDREVLEAAGHVDPPPSSLSPLQLRAIALIRLIEDPFLVAVIPMLEGLRGSSPAQRSALLQELRTAVQDNPHA